MGNYSLKGLSSGYKEFDIVYNKISSLASSFEKTTVSRNFLDNILKHMRSALFVCNDLGEIIMINEGAKTLLSYESRDLLGYSIKKIFPSLHLPFSFKAPEKDNSSEDIFKSEVQLVDSKLKTLDVIFSVTWIYSSKGGKYICVAEDITELKQVSRSLENEKTRVQKASEEKTRFLAKVSHEIRTPLNAILGFTHLLKSQLKVDPSLEKNSMYVKQIDMASKTLVNKVNDVLDMQKIESGEVEMEYKPIDTKDFLDRIYTIYNMDAKNRGIHFHYEIVDKVPSTFVSDEKKLYSTLSNIITNALKFTQSGGEVFYSLDLQDEQLVFSCRDTGVGISEEDIEKIFEPYQQSASAKMVEFKGTGLGLSISKKYLELLQGKILVRSKVGLGTEFIVTLPYSNEGKVQTGSKV